MLFGAVLFGAVLCAVHCHPAPDPVVLVAGRSFSATLATAVTLITAAATTAATASVTTHPTRTTKPRFRFATELKLLSSKSSLPLPHLLQHPLVHAVEHAHAQVLPLAHESPGAQRVSRASSCAGPRHGGA